MELRAQRIVIKNKMSFRLDGRVGWVAVVIHDGSLTAQCLFVYNIIFS